MPKFDKPFRDSFALLRLVLIFCTFATLTAAAPQPVFAQQENAQDLPAPPRIGMVSGTASFWRPGAENWSPAQVNMPLAAGDALYTAAVATLEVQIGPRAYVRMAQNAMLTLLDNEPELQQFKMSSGIAVSDGHSFRYRNYTQLQQGDIDYEVADVVVKLVAQLEQQLKKTHQRLLPLGIGLNVNIPAFVPGTGGKIKYQLTRLGRQAGIYYSDDLSQNPNVKAFGISMPSAPGFP